MTGSVRAFDRERGLGEIEADGVTYVFHATQIADESRDVAVGTAVEFTVVPGLPGHWEAALVTTRRRHPQN